MKSTSPPLKLFVVRKYILARSAKEAIKLDKSHAVDDVWIDDDWKKENKNYTSDTQKIGFKTFTPSSDGQKEIK